MANEQLSLEGRVAVVTGGTSGIGRALAPGVFRTPLNQALLEGTEREREILLRTPLRRLGDLEELVGAAIFLSSESASFVNGEVLDADGGFLASGVNP